MSLYLEGSVYEKADSVFIKNLKEVLEKGMFQTKTEYHRGGSVKIQFKKELLDIQESEMLYILSTFNETPEEVRASKFIEDRKILLEQYKKRIEEGQNEVV